jgi:nucleoside-diphosphate-sugar epimerase
VKVAIAGGHGKIGMRLARILSERGDEVRSLIRNPDHAAEVSETGAEPVVCDLEQASVEDVAEAIDAVDAVVFAAGAGAGSGPERKQTMDYGGAVKLIEGAKAKEVGTYVMVSSMGADPDIAGDETFQVYQRAKGRADAALSDSGLDYVIVRPGGLTDEPGTGKVTLGEHVGRGQVSRDDVVAVIASVLRNPPSGWRTVELIGGETPIEDALGSL